MKKFLGLLLSVMIIVSPVGVNANNRMSDTNGHWAETQIQEFVDRGYVGGYADGTFKPNNFITRAEFVTIVNKYFAFTNEGVSTSTFSDVNSNDWFSKDVSIAANNGYVNGYNDGTFKPNNHITREEAIKIIVDIKNKEDYGYNKVYHFLDASKVSNWAMPYVEGAIEEGFIMGDNSGNLNPTNNITRAEAVSMLYRITGVENPNTDKILVEISD